MIIKLYFQLISALNEAHACDVFHRNVKADNCLLDDNFNLVLCDFGVARDHNNTVQQTYDIGTRSYMSPELMGTMNLEYNY